MEDECMDAEDFKILCAEWKGIEIPQKPDMDLTLLYNSVILNETKESNGKVQN